MTSTQISSSYCCVSFIGDYVVWHFGCMSVLTISSDVKFNSMPNFPGLASAYYDYESFELCLKRSITLHYISIVHFWISVYSSSQCCTYMEPLHRLNNTYKSACFIYYTINFKHNNSEANIQKCICPNVPYLSTGGKEWEGEGWSGSHTLIRSVPHIVYEAYTYTYIYIY